MPALRMPASEEYPFLENVEGPRDLRRLPQVRFLEQDTRAVLSAECGLDAAGILRTVCRHSHRRPQIAYSRGTKS